MPEYTHTQALLVYPWRKESRCRLLAGEAAWLPALLSAIDAARDYVLVEMYLVQPGAVTNSIFSALAEAAGRGVRVHVALDHFGARQLGRTDLELLTDAGVATTFYRPFRWLRPHRYLVRDHRKFIAIDGRVAMTGGFGLCDGLPTKDGYLPWHDFGVQVEGRVVADIEQAMADHWHRLTETNLRLASARPLAREQARDQAVGESSGGMARVVCSRPTRMNPIYGHLRQRAALAGNRIWIATAYFLPSWRLRRALVRAANRGVDVRLLLPGELTDNPAVRYASQRYYGDLLQAGARIFEYQPRFMHAKAAIVDEWLSLGSSNFDRWGLQRTLEGNLEIMDAEVTTTVAQWFRASCTDSREIQLDEWHHRPPPQLWRERAWGALEAWINRWR